jgi:NADH:ubiquinone oxidoreductase subunit E
MDSADLLDWCRDLQAAQLPIQYSESLCTGNCTEAPVVQWNGRYETEASPERLTELLVEEDLM